MSEPSSPGLIRGLLQCVLLLLAIKAAWLLLDPTVRFFMGDSGSYLHTALTHWIPPDRSILYGWLIGATAVAAHSIYPLLLVQTAFGIASGLLLYAWLRAGLKLRHVWSMFAAALFALEPAQLFYERMMMAEATGLLAFLLFFGAMSAYVATRHWILIPVYALLGMAAIAFRINLLAVVLVLSVLAPLIVAFSTRRDGASPRRVVLLGLLHLALSLVATGYVHASYKRWNADLNGTASLPHGKPGYTAMAGVFRLALVAPLIEPEHFRNTGVSPDVLREVKIDYRDPRARESQIWLPDGLYDVLKRHTDDPDRAARKISIRAAREHPFGLLRMGLMNIADYFDPTIALPRLYDDMGTRAPDQELLEALREHFDYDASGVNDRVTPALSWFAAGAPWLTACLILLAPLALATFWIGWRSPGRELRLLLALTSLGLVACHVLFSHIVSFRYLHPLPWFVLANAVALFAALRLRASTSGGTPSGASSGS